MSERVKFSIEQQVIEQRNEVAISENFFRNRVAKGMVSEEKAEARIGLKRAILSTLRMVEKHQGDIRALLERKKAEDERRQAETHLPADRAAS